MAAFDMHPVAPTPQPVYTAEIQEAVEVAPMRAADGTWHQRWKILERFADPAERAAALQLQMERAQAQLSAHIDTAVADASAPPLRFTQEYLRRESQARAYLVDFAQLAPGSIPPPAPRLIAKFAASAGLSDVQAARLTVQQADDLYAKLDALSDLRMRKYEIKHAKSLEEAHAAFELIMAEIQAVAATIT